MTAAPTHRTTHTKRFVEYKKPVIFFVFIFMLQGIFSPARSEGTGHVEKERLMPLGDSLTAGDGSTHEMGYRKKIQDLLGVDTYQFVGPDSRGVLSDYQSEHTGKIGFGTESLKAFVTTEMPAYFGPKDRKGIILLMVGTNDFLAAAFNVKNSVKNIMEMVDFIDQYNPRIKIYVACPIPIAFKEPSFLAYRTPPAGLTEDTFPVFRKELISSLAMRKRTKSNLYIVDMYSAFVNDETGLCYGNYKINCLVDGVHPNDAGYDVMGVVWANSINHCKKYDLCS